MGRKEEEDGVLRDERRFLRFNRITVKRRKSVSILFCIERAGRRYFLSSVIFAAIEFEA